MGTRPPAADRLPAPARAPASPRGPLAERGAPTSRAPNPSREPTSPRGPSEPAPPASAPSVSRRRLPRWLRARYLLLAVALYFGVRQLAPRAEAYVALRTLAGARADYAVCMAGPTGLDLLRQDPDEFVEVLRRRVLLAAPDARPFHRCVSLGRDAGLSDEARWALSATAVEFPEFLGHAGRCDGKRPSVDCFRLGEAALHRAALASWPFFSGEPDELVAVSEGFTPAEHPTELPATAEGRGLPDFTSLHRAARFVDGRWLLAEGRAVNLDARESRDGGLSWKPVPAWTAGLADFAERCDAGPDRGVQLGSSAQGASWVLTTLGPDAPPERRVVADGRLEPVGLACDAAAAVVAFRDEHDRALFAHCPWRDACRALEVPSPLGEGKPLTAPVDVARLHGVTVVSAVVGATVRVTTSRDGGQFAPWVVAWAARHERRPDFRRLPPYRLLVLGDDVLLHGQPSAADKRYPMLRSTNEGASFQEPLPDAAAPPVIAAAE